ncbi:Na+/H+ antiporter NhaC family protein [Oscillibacter ruminantium]|uniref:Na+/H+ antiporter NhaC family protein n=1 Tax=Oscillibacter ruminantium TaxID=1263547 RepID=UPI0002DC95A4|nr:Na+/H+ antiporter NhaC family protein [Oscillibacter ruminantium]MDN0031665.1 Na+/H+ antiporter NhaC family protein [Oscillibacter valericigenes]MEA5042057.1 Na+/H+ antiporter NhaC family protein [Oscillibacter ruminantium]
MESYGALALLPPLVAIVLCFATKQVLISMFMGLFTGCLIVSGWNPLGGISYSLKVLVDNLGDPDNALLVIFTMFMGVGIAFIWRLGGSFALAEAAKHRFKKRRSVCLGTWGLGICTSINDCLVAAVDGNVFRDICKEYRISSEKLSYVLDSTAAPAAALLISDWIAYQISMIKQGLDMAGISDVQPMAAYVHSIPFNMYSILTLLFVAFLMYTGKDYGPMLKAEARCLSTGKFTRDGASPMMDVGNELGDPKMDKPMVKTFVLPIGLALATILGGIVWTGREYLSEGVMAVLENCDASSALLWGSFVMAATGIVLALTTRIMTFAETMSTIVDGFKLMVLTGAILVMAWSLGSITKELGLASFVVELIGDNVPFGVLPPLVLLLSILIAFATGTSWGTMAIMTPLAISMGYQLTGDVNMSIGMAGAVLSGAILGDHSSPVSDTTVMASIFSGADHIDHVGTQLPYALTVGGVILVLYTIYGFTACNPLILLPVGLVLLCLLATVLHKIDLKRYHIDPSYADNMTKAFK